MHSLNVNCFIIIPDVKSAVVLILFFSEVSLKIFLRALEALYTKGKLNAFSECWENFKYASIHSRESYFFSFFCACIEILKIFEFLIVFRYPEPDLSDFGKCFASNWSRQ